MIEVFNCILHSISKFLKQALVNILSFVDFPLSAKWRIMYAAFQFAI